MVALLVGPALVRIKDGGAGLGTLQRLLGAKECFIQDGGRASVTKQSTEWTLDVAGNMSLNGRPICGDAEMPSRGANNTEWQY